MLALMMVQKVMLNLKIRVVIVIIQQLPEEMVAGQELVQMTEPVMLMRVGIIIHQIQVYRLQLLPKVVVLQVEVSVIGEQHLRMVVMGTSKLPTQH